MKNLYVKISNLFLPLQGAITLVSKWSLWYFARHPEKQYRKLGQLIGHAHSLIWMKIQILQVKWAKKIRLHEDDKTEFNQSNKKKLENVDFKTSRAQKHGRILNWQNDVKDEKSSDQENRGNVT